MPTKSFSIRISQSAPDVTAEQAAVWLAAHVAEGGSLALDPGAGEKTLRLSLDAGLVKQAAKAAGEPEATFLRRLIASNATISPESAPATEAKPKAPILRGSLKLRAEQVRPLVSAYGQTQSFLIRKALKAPDAAREAGLTPDETDHLAANVMEVVNRRAPAALVERIDLIGLGLDLVSISWQKVDAVRDFVARRQKQQARQQAAPAAAQPSGMPGLEIPSDSDLEQ